MTGTIIIVVTIVVVAFVTALALSNMILKKLEKIQSSLDELNENVKKTNDILTNVGNISLETADKRNSTLSSISEDFADIEDLLLNGKKDPLLIKVAEECSLTNFISFHGICKKYNIGFNRTKKIINQLCSMGVLGPASSDELDGKIDRWTGRDVHIKNEDFEKMKEAGEFN